jgi:hypothetical protein
MDRKLKVGVVGFGYWGPNLVRNVGTELFVVDGKPMFGWCLK